MCVSVRANPTNSQRLERLRRETAKRKKKRRRKIQQKFDYRSLEECSSRFKHQGGRRWRLPRPEVTLSLADVQDSSGGGHRTSQEYSFLIHSGKDTWTKRGLWGEDVSDYDHFCRSHRKGTKPLTRSTDEGWTSREGLPTFPM